MLPEVLYEVMENIFQDGSILVFLDSLDKGIMIINKNMSIIYLNKMAKENFKENGGRIQGRPIHKYIPFNKMEDVLIHSASFSAVAVELEYGTKYVNISPIGINGEVLGAVIVFEEEKHGNNILDTLKLSKGISRELEEVFNSAYDEIIVTDNTGIILKINTIYEKFYDLKLHDFVGKNVSELEHMGFFNSSITQKVIEQRKKVILTQRTNLGKILLVTGNPIFDGNNELVFVITVSKDITAIHHRDRLSESKEIAQKYYYKLELLKEDDKEEGEILYKSSQMKKVMAVAEKVAKVDSNVLITGDSGVGKSMLAEIIHKMSERRDKNFVNINCGAIPESLLESELFGYEKGAFTGARNDGKIGQIDLADGGTLFLDEISELPFLMQVKLLKVINEKKFIRVGGTKSLFSNFRLIAATNKDLRKMVREGKFREDLFYRLNVIPMEIPPLRERKEDITLLIHHFWEQLNKKFGTNRRIAQETYDFLMDYDWPGNVRELQNSIERIMVTVDKNMVKVCDLPAFIFEQAIYDFDKTGGVPLKDVMENVERKMILKAYGQFKNTYRVAEVLGISQPTVVRKLKKYNGENGG